MAFYHNSISNGVQGSIISKKYTNLLGSSCSVLTVTFLNAASRQSVIFFELVSHTSDKGSFGGWILQFKVLKIEEE